MDVWEQHFDRFGLGEGGRELAVLEQQLRVCLREAESEVAAGAAGGSACLSIAEGRSPPQQNIAACARVARPSTAFVIAEGAARSWPQVQIDASLPPQRQRFSDTLARASESGEMTSLMPFGSAGAMGLNLRAIQNCQGSM